MKKRCFFDLTLFAFFIIAILMISACQTLPEPQPVEPAPAPIVTPVPKPMTLSWDADKKPNEAWNKILIEAVLSSGLHKVAIKDREFCPKYDDLVETEKHEFWAQLISRMVKWESNYKPEAKMAECRKDKCIYGSCSKHPTLGFCMKGGHKLDGGVVISRGLIQMSLESSLALGCDWLKKPEDLHDPAKNLQCAVKALTRYVVRDEQIAGNGPGDWKGGARYWAVLRGTSDYTKKTLADIKKYTSSLSFCK